MKKNSFEDKKIYSDQQKQKSGKIQEKKWIQKNHKLKQNLQKQVIQRLKKEKTRKKYVQKTNLIKL